MHPSDFAKTFGEEPPPPSLRHTYKILSPKIGVNVKAHLVSNRPLGTWTHFRQNTSYPCTRNPKTCPFCAPPFRSSPRWKAYCCAVDVVRGGKVLIELTAGAVHGSQPLSDPAQDLRGMIIEMWRRGKEHNSPVMVNVRKPESWEKPKRLPDAWDLQAVLLEMWGDPSQMWHPSALEMKDGDQDGQIIPC